MIKSSGEAFAEALLTRFGGRIRRFIVEEPTLESVFLSLTGRELRDRSGECARAHLPVRPTRRRAHEMTGEHTR